MALRLRRSSPEKCGSPEGHEPSQFRTHATRHGKQAVVIEPVKEDLPSLNRIERVLGERVGACSRRRKGVYEGDLDDIESLLLARQVAASLVIDEGNARVALEMTCEITETVVHDTHDVAIDLHCEHALLAEKLGGQDVSSAAGADDGYAAAGAQVVHEVGKVPAQELHLFQIAVEADELGTCNGVNLQPTAFDIERPLEFGAEVPSQRAGFAGFQHRDPGEGIPAFVIDSLLFRTLDVLNPESGELVSRKVDTCPDRGATQYRADEHSYGLALAGEKNRCGQRRERRAG